MLINLDCAHEGNLFSEVVFRFTLPGGKRLPRTRFSQRDNVRVSRVISPSGSQASQAAPQRTPRNRQARPESKEGDRRGAEESGVEENSFAEWSESSPDEDQAKSLVKREVCNGLGIEALASARGGCVRVWWPKQACEDAPVMALPAEP